MLYTRGTKRDTVLVFIIMKTSEGNKYYIKCPQKMSGNGMRENLYPRSVVKQALANKGAFSPEYLSTAKSYFYSILES